MPPISRWQRCLRCFQSEGKASSSNNCWGSKLEEGPTLMKTHKESEQQICQAYNLFSDLNKWTLNTMGGISLLGDLGRTGTLFTSRVNRLSYCKLWIRLLTCRFPILDFSKSVRPGIPLPRRRQKEPDIRSRSLYADTGTAIRRR